MTTVDGDDSAVLTTGDRTRTSASVPAPPAAPAPSTAPARLALEQPVSRADRVRDVIQAAILDATLPQGSALVERELSAMLGVSKTPIREALKQLQSSGLVVATAYLGMRVRVLDTVIVREVMDARLAVEPEALRIAIRARGAQPHPEARRLLAEAAELVRSDDTAQLAPRNRQFHRALWVESANPLLVEFLDKLDALSTFIATSGWRAEATYATEAGEHEQLLAAYEAADADLAARLLREHITRSAASASRTMSSPEATEATA